MASSRTQSAQSRVSSQRAMGQIKVPPQQFNIRGFSVQFFLVELIVFKGWTFAWPSSVDSFTQICKANRRSNRSSQPSELDEAGSPD